jgi:hypothetical protein
VSPCVWNAWNPWSACVCGKATSRIRVQNTALSQNSILCWTNLTHEASLCSVVEFCKSDNDPADADEACALLVKSYTEEYFRWVFPEMVPVIINCSSDLGVFTITTALDDPEYLQNATSILQTEASYILGVTESSFPAKIEIGGVPLGGEVVKRAAGDNGTLISFDVASAYPPNYLILIVAVCVAVPCAILFFVLWYLFYRRMKLKTLTKDRKLFFFFRVFKFSF